jgi:hypothetical protein
VTRRVAVLLLVAACGRELNPKFCAAHPDDERCDTVVGVDAAVDAMVDASAPACPTSYVALGSLPSRYRAEDAVNDWLSAAARCAADGTNTHLVVLSDPAERDALAPVMDRYRFVGHSDAVTEGKFVPVTDEPVAYPAIAAKTSPPWDPGEPNDSGDCVVMSDALALYDRDCSNEDQAFLCECDAYPDDPANY